MSFALVCIAGLLLLAIVAAVASRFQGGSDEVTTGHDCSTCTSNDGSCKIACLMEEKRRHDNESGKNGNNKNSHLHAAESNKTKHL